jgi:glutamate synthase (ferredoxin)
MLAGTIARAHGNKGFNGSIKVTFTGSTGQSFGSYCLPGLALKVIGECNDYVAKGMHGGSISIVPPPIVGYEHAKSSIAGNACLYGATGGDFHAAGRAGERFAVRNSGAYAVVEGTGDHCCEYMTGGVVVVLGNVGRNVGAGMTGGLGYFYDDGTGPDFLDNVNNEIVKAQRVESGPGKTQLRTIVERHVALTDSVRGKKLLANWDEEVKKFWQVYVRANERIESATTPCTRTSAQKVLLPTTPCARTSA